MKMGGGSKMQMVAAAWIIAVAAVTTSVCYAQESQADCLKRCMSSGCGSNQQGMCSMNCAITCHWPFSQPTGEVMVTQEAGMNGADAAAVQAVFSAGAGEPVAANHQPAPAP